MLTIKNFCIKHKKDCEIALNILIIFILSRLLMLIVCVLYNVINDTGVHFVNAINKWDASWYKSIVDYGYSLIPGSNNQTNWAFSPLYPMVVRLVKYIFPFDTNILFVIVSNICICIGAFFASKYYLIRTGSSNSILFVFLTLCGPYSLYFSAGYAESMFYMFLAMSLFFINKKYYVWAGITSALATLTRSYGVFIVFIMVIYIFQDNFEKISLKNIFECFKNIFMKSNYFLGVLLCPLGLFIYMLYMYIHVGDIWAFYRTTVIGWQNKTYHLNFLSMDMNEFYLTIFLFVMFLLAGYLLYNKFYGEGFIGFIICSQHIAGVSNIGRHCIAHIFPLLAICLIIEKNKNLESVMVSFIMIYETLLIYLWYSGVSVMI